MTDPVRNLYEAYLNWVEEPMTYEKFDELNRENIQQIIGSLSVGEET